MSIADDGIEDCEIGLLWAEQFTKIATDAGSSVIVLSLVYIIERKAKRRARGMAIGEIAFTTNSDITTFHPMSFGKFKARRIGNDHCR
jgi:hypothetical protein